MKKSKAPVITTDELTRPGGYTQFWIVKADGVVIGFLEKWRDDKFTTNPYKAYVPICGQGPVRAGEMIGTFYTDDGGRTGAIKALLNESH